MIRNFVAIFLLSSSYAVAKTCPDVGGIYTSGKQHQCLDWIENVGPYMCQTYKIITQRGCEELSFFEKEIVVNRDANTHQYDNSSFMRLKKSNFSNIFFNVGDASNIPINHEEFFPPSDGSGYCYANKIKVTPDGADGFLITVFNCGSGTFIETQITSGTNLRILQRSDKSEWPERPIPGPWNSWQKIEEIAKEQVLPDNTWLYDWLQGNMAGNVKLKFHHSNSDKFNDWAIEGIGGRLFYRSEWNNLNDLEIQKTLNQLDKNKNYLCAIKAMTTMTGENSSYRATSLLVESITNCRLL